MGFLLLKATHLEVKYVSHKVEKCLTATEQIATNLGSLQPNNVVCSAEFNCTILVQLWIVPEYLEPRSRTMNNIMLCRNSRWYYK